MDFLYSKFIYQRRTIKRNYSLKKMNRNDKKTNFKSEDELFYKPQIFFAGKIGADQKKFENNQLPWKWIIL